MSEPMLGVIMLCLLCAAIMIGYPTAFTLMALGVFFGYLGFGDLVFALATGRSGKSVGLDEAIDLYAAAGATMARAIARGVHAATAAEGD
ncbi:hypothetical protein QML00_28625, partial [Klebsiella pneumoniae]